MEESHDINPEENLRLENQIKRLELELKGAKFLEHNPEGIQLPPEVEAQMLDQIMEFEKMKLEAKEVIIFDFLGKPNYKSIDKLSSEEIILEKEKLLEIMRRKGILLTSMEELEDSIMYRFITEEFFQKKMLDMPVKGFVRHFIYEEFHPNEKLTVEKTVEFVLQTFLNEEEEAPIFLLTRDAATQYLIEFKKFYRDFQFNHLRFESFDVKKIKGSVQLYIDFEAFLEGSLKSHRYEGVITVSLRKRKGIWQINQLEFPKPI